MELVVVRGLLMKEMLKEVVELVPGPALQRQAKYATIAPVRLERREIRLVFGGVRGI
jgi:hypothetical protein